MAEELETISSSIGQLDTLASLLASSTSLQMAIAVLIVGLVIIGTLYKKFRSWSRRKKFSYSNPLFAEVVRRATLPILALMLISSMNFYIQTFELFDEPASLLDDEERGQLTAAETFAKLLNSMNILIIVYTVGHFITIVLEKSEKMRLEKEDYKIWRDMGGFKDDKDDLFHRCFKWIPPKHPPEDMNEKEFRDLLETKEGVDFLEKYTTSTGSRIGSYQKLVKDPLKEWKESEREKYEKYYKDCVTGENESGRPLLPGKIPDEIYEIDVWKEEKRFKRYEPIIPGEKPPGYAEKKREGLPKPFRNFIPLGIFLISLAGIAATWGVDLVVLDLH